MRSIDMDAPRGGVDVSFEGDMDECVKWGLFPFNYVISVQIEYYTWEYTELPLGVFEKFYI